MMMMSEPRLRNDEHSTMESLGAPRRAEAPKKHQKAFENSQSRLDGRLDQALEETFPASDPVAVFISL
jgi:hypothetical protein